MTTDTTKPAKAAPAPKADTVTKADFDALTRRVAKLEHAAEGQKMIRGEDEA